MTAAPNTSLPPRTADTMSEAIAQSSPSGRISKRAAAAGNERLRVMLFGPHGLQPAPLPRPSRADKLRWRIRDLRAMADRGMCKRAFTKEANALQIELDAIESA